MQVRLVLMCFAALTILLQREPASARPIPMERTALASLAEVVLEQAQAMSDAAVTGDDVALADFTYPAVIAALGGRLEAIASLQLDRAELEERNYGLTAVSVISATVPRRAGSELHSIVTSYQYMRGPGALFRAKTYMIAASSDEGENWTFVNVPQHNPDAIKAMFPVWNAALEIPQPPEPERVDLGAALGIESQEH